MFIVLANANAQIEPLDTDDDGLRNISSLDHILYLSQHSDYWGYSYELDRDIDLEATKIWNEGFGFSPIGIPSQPFTGVFDGNNFALTKLTITRPDEDNLGFFGVISSNAYIRNIRITNAEISGSSYVGIICGKNFGLMDNIYANGNITAKKSYVGGITGENSGTIQYCITYTQITGSEAYNGGVAGENYGSIYNSRSFGAIHSAYIIGGLVGDNSGLISNCYSRMNIYAQDNYIGGLAGSNWESGTIINSYSTGEVKGSGYYQGGLVGYKHNSAKDVSCFWDTEASDIYESMGGEGKTTSEMKDASTFLSENWDFNDIWTMSSTVNSGYPYIRAKATSTTETETIAKPIITFIQTPNNTSLDIHILAQSNSFSQFRIYDCLGSLVFQNNELFLNKGVNKILQNRSGLSNGVYFAVVLMGNQVCTQKFILE
jgi:hypothetical protein